jgi:peptidoglycan biosynthesis protein MviN/MurJ (putative lipid II flippase)
MNQFFKIFVFIILSSTVLTLLFNYLYEDNGMVVMGAAIPGSIIASVLLVIVDYFFIKKTDDKLKINSIRIITLIIIYLIVLTVIMNVGDLWFDIRTYFNPNYGYE